MLKSILAVVVSYIVMMIVFFAIFTGLYLVLGAEKVFEPGTFKISALWIALSLIVALGTGMLAGFLCQKIGGSLRVSQVLAVMVCVLGLAMCYPAIMADQTPRPRAENLATMEAMQQGQAPIWMHLLSAVLAGAGVLLGARVKSGAER